MDSETSFARSAESLNPALNASRTKVLLFVKYFLLEYYLLMLDVGLVDPISSKFTSYIIN